MTGILTTHVGSLPRSAAVTDVLFAVERGEQVDPAVFDETIGAGVDEAVRRQVEAGIDLVSDGEMAKISYATYIKDRITGFDGDSPRRAPADLQDFPSFLERQAKGGGTPTGDITALTGGENRAILRPTDVVDTETERHFLSCRLGPAAEHENA